MAVRYKLLSRTVTLTAPIEVGDAIVEPLIEQLVDDLETALDVAVRGVVAKYPALQANHQVLDFTQ